MKRSVRTARGYQLDLHHRSRSAVLVPSTSAKELLKGKGTLLLYSVLFVGSALGQETGVVPGVINAVQTQPPVADSTRGDRRLLSDPGNSDLVLGGGDSLSITVLDVPEMTGKFRVEENGDMSLPLLGIVPTRGLTATQLEKRMRDLLVEKQLVLHPQVSVQVLEFGAQGITVGGEVLRAGVYPAFGTKHLYEVLSLAGGLNSQAGNIATIFRRGEGTPIRINLRDEHGELRLSNVELHPGDTVIVQRAGMVYVLGDVQKPGGFLVDRPSISSLEALALAQGATKTTALDKARILRKDSTGYHEINFDFRPVLNAKAEDLPLRDGDILYLPMSGGKNFYQNSTQGIVGSLAGAMIYALAR